MVAKAISETDVSVSMGKLSLFPSLVTPVYSNFGVSLLLPLNVKCVVSVPLAALNRINICLFLSRPVWQVCANPMFL